MRKGFVKNLACLGLSLSLFGVAVGVSGCDYDPTRDISSALQTNYLVTKDVYIVVQENGIDTLHKGDIHVPYTTETNGYSFVLPTILKFNCGKELQTYQFVAYIQDSPTAENYDRICDCAYEISEQKESETHETEETKSHFVVKQSEKIL